MLVKNNEEFNHNLNKGIVLIDFFAEWCGPCKMLLPIINDLEKTWTKGKIIKVNVDELPELSEKFNVQTIPTLVYLKDGKEVDRTVGYVTKDSILLKLTKLEE